MGPKPKSEGTDGDDGNEGMYLLRDQAEKITPDGPFGHYQYVETLLETIKEVDSPWQIALYGRWGTGKSSILLTLQEELKGESDQSSREEGDGDTIEYIEFDAWQHPADSIKTQFLLNLDEELSERAGTTLLGEEQITEELLDVTISEPLDIPEPQNRITKKLQQLSDRLWIWTATSWHVLSKNKVLIIPLIFVFLFWVLLAIRPQYALLDEYGQSALLGSLIVSLVLLLLREISNTRISYKRMVNPRQDWAGAYEDLFERILSAYQDERTESKFVIAIDNLDRCQPDAVFEILISMKTFFEPEDYDCLYIVPCDDEMLRQHIASANLPRQNEELDFLDDGLKDEDEFLRKFFQTTVQLPPLEVQNIEQFANDQFSKLRSDRQPSDTAVVIDLLTKLDVHTPRRIKTIINQFLSLRGLAIRLESDGRLEYGTVTENEGFLIKVLLIKEYFPKVYQQAKRDPNFISRLHEAAGNDLDETNFAIASDGGTPVSASSDTSSQSADLGGTTSQLNPAQLLSEEPDLHRFLRQTQEYHVDPPHPFVYLGDARFSHVLGQYTNFAAALRKGDTETAIQELQETELQAAERELERVIRHALSRSLDEHTWSPNEAEPEIPSLPPSEVDSNSRDHGHPVVILQTVFEVIAESEGEDQSELIRGFYEFFQEPDHFEHLFAFDPHGVWPAIYQFEQTKGGTELSEKTIEFTIDPALADDSSHQHAILSQILSTIEATSNRDYEEWLANRLQEELRRFSGTIDDTKTFENIAILLQQNLTAAPLLLSEELYSSFVAQLPPRTQEEVLNTDVYTTLLEIDSVLDESEFTDEEIQDLTDSFVSSVFNLCLPRPEEPSPKPLKRLKTLDFTHITEQCGGEIHRRLSTLFMAVDSPTLSDEYFELLQIWLSVYKDVIGFEPQPTDQYELFTDEGEWASIPVKDTFIGLFEKLRGPAAGEFTELIVEYELTVFDRHPILTAFLDYISEESIEDELILDVLSLVDEGELAPLEEHVKKRIDDGQPPQVAYWAGIAEKVPQKFTGIQEELGRECVSICEKHKGPQLVRMLPYATLLYDEFSDEPALQDRILDLIKDALVAKRRELQRAAARSLRYLDESNNQREIEAIQQRAVHLVIQEYRNDSRPSSELEKWVLRKAQTDRAAQIRTQRVDYICREIGEAAAIDEQIAAFQLLLEEVKETPEILEQIDEERLTEELGERFKVHSPFEGLLEELDRSLETLEHENE